MSHLEILQQKNCTPWDYPLPQGEDTTPLCTSYVDGIDYFNSLKDFNLAMEDTRVVDNCTKACQPSCEEITYTSEIDTTDLEIDRLCEDGKPTRDVILESDIFSNL